MKQRNAGFTLIELMVVGFVMCIVVFIAISVTRGGLYREYEISQQMRSVVNGLHLARFRGLENRVFITLTSATPINPASGWYPRIQFVAANHGFKTGDLITFSGLTVHTSMNVGRYYCTVVDDNTFNCEYYTETGTGDAAGAIARNTSSAASLTIMKLSYVDSLYPHSSLTNPTTYRLRSEMLANPQNFVYNDQRVQIWDPTVVGLTAAAVAAPTYLITLSFDYRGYPANQTGYQLAFGKGPTPDMVIRKLIIVAPTGKISPGA